jgi:hypothetical protein
MENTPCASAPDLEILCAILAAQKRQLPRGFWTRPGDRRVGQKPDSRSPKPNFLRSWGLSPKRSPAFSKEIAEVFSAAVRNAVEGQVCDLERSEGRRNRVPTGSILGAKSIRTMANLT